MNRTHIQTSLLWGAAFGLLEAAYFARANHAYPFGTGHLLLALAMVLGFAMVTLAAGALAAAISRGRGGAASVLAALAGPWLLVVSLAVTVYRERINPRPGNWQGLAGTVITVALLVLLLVVACRLWAGRRVAVRRFLLVTGAVLLLAGGTWLVTVRSPGVVAGGKDSQAAALPESRDTGLRVMLIGLDGGTWKIYDPLLEKGLLPAHAALIERGVTADLKVCLPSYSPPLWTSIASSRTVAEHGIHDHIRTALPFGMPTVPHQVKYLSFLTKPTRIACRTLNRIMPFQPVYAVESDVLVRRLWDILDEHGYPTLVVDWYVTYPARPCLGIMISDQLHRNKDHGAGMPGLVYPDSLTPLFEQLVVTPQELPDERLFALIDADDLSKEGRRQLKDRFAPWFRVIGQEMARDLSTAAIVREAFPRLPQWRFAGIYYRAMDNIHHMNWHWKDLPAGDLQDHPERRFRAAVDRYYEYCDRLLADVLRFADERTVVIVMSDHGFENARYAHSRAPDGFFIMAGGPVRTEPVRGEVHVYDIAPTVLALLGMPVAEDMQGRVAREFIDPSFWRQHPIRTVPTYEIAPRTPLESPTLEMDEKAIEHLRALGYVD